jgi:hypothetical protein
VIRRILAGLLVLTFAAVALVAQDRPAAGQDEPPVRLKKKDRPKAEPQEPARPKEEAKPDKEPTKPPVGPDKKPKEEERLKKGDEPPDMPEEPEVDEEEVLNRALKNSRTAEERLANKEADERTRQVQRDVLKDLDSLIDLAKQAQQNQDQQGEQQQANGEQQQDKQQGGKPQQQKGAMGGKKGRGKQVAQARGRRDRRQARGGQQRQQGEQGGDQQTAQQQGQGGGKSNTGGRGGMSSQEENHLADVYKDVWGHMPEGLRNAMNAYSREEFMAKYKDQLKQYYATIAEKGRRKD